MTQGFSKENQRTVEAAYQFGEFALYPQDRVLQRSDMALPIQPKAFDALLCLVRKAQHLVSKEELVQTLWPSVHVSEANLTNTIVTLRKLLGRDAIRTVSKHGYRFELPVTGEPGVTRTGYENFVRARELTAQRSIECMQLARDLYWTCLAEDPNFAPAWAWLGRCCWFLEKFSDASGHSSANAELANAAFRRAFLLDPDLADAHQFCTVLQVDTGQVGEAIHRLLERLKRHPGEPESYAGLVQALRFQGLLDASLTAHKRAVELDPTVATSVAHTLFLKGEYASAIESYSGRAGYYLDAAAWAALGVKERALTLLRQRVGQMELSPLMTSLLRSLTAVLEGKREEAVRWMEGADTTREPEILVYFARNYACLGDYPLAVKALQQASRAGFLCAPETLRTDPWLKGLEARPEYAEFVSTAETAIQKAETDFRQYQTFLDL